MGQQHLTIWVGCFVINFLEIIMLKLNIDNEEILQKKKTKEKNMNILRENFFEKKIIGKEKENSLILNSNDYRLKNLILINF